MCPICINSLSRLHNTLLNLSFIKMPQIVFVQFFKILKPCNSFHSTVLEFSKINLKKAPCMDAHLIHVLSFCFETSFFKMTKWLKGWLKCSCANVHTTSEGRCFVTKRKGGKNYESHFVHLKRQLILLLSISIFLDDMYCNFKNKYHWVQFFL